MFPPKRQPEPEPESAPDPRVLTLDEQRASHRWSNLMDLGFSMDQVLRMKIGRPEFDWHEAEAQLKAGQNHEQVTFRLED